MRLLEWEDVSQPVTCPCADGVETLGDTTFPK